MASVNQLEDSLNDVFVKKAPVLPEGGKKFIVDIAPWLALVGGVLTLWAGLNLWHWAHTVNPLIDYANSLSAAYGGTKVAANNLSFGIWLGIAVLILEGILYLLAFPGLRARKKSGWNLVFYVSLINIVYGFILMFTAYGSVFSFIGSLIGSAIGMYLLFQVRSRYVAVAPTKPVRK